jgi:hypothetical protein
MAGMTIARGAALVVAAPPVLLALGWIGMLAMTAFTGEHPLWRLEARNLAEAAALRDSGAIVRLVDSGADLKDAGNVRPGIVFDDAVMLTPLQAAAASRDSSIVQLLFDLGATPDRAEWQRARCLATASSVQEVLDQHQPPGARTECDDAR